MQGTFIKYFLFLKRNYVFKLAHKEWISIRRLKYTLSFG